MGSVEPLDFDEDDSYEPISDLFVDDVGVKHRAALDDELPELSHSLMQLLWPNYMRPLPAFSMLQFQPLNRPGPALRVERETQVESNEVEGVNCQFRTCYPTEILPLQLVELKHSVKGEGSMLSLRLDMTCDGHLGELKLSRLRLHLAGERYISQMLVPAHGGVEDVVAVLVAQLREARGDFTVAFLRFCRQANPG